MEQNLRVELDPPPDWTLSESFPGAAGSEIGTMQVTKPRLVFDSAVEVTVREALTFSAGVPLKQLVPGLKGLLGRTLRCQLSGPVSVARGDRAVATSEAEATTIHRAADPVRGDRLPGRRNPTPDSLLIETYPGWR